MAIEARGHEKQGRWWHGGARTMNDGDGSGMPANSRARWRSGRRWSWDTTERRVRSSGTAGNG
jgi:hypothetical protein